MHPNRFLERQEGRLRRRLLGMDRRVGRIAAPLSTLNRSLRISRAVSSSGWGGVKACQGPRGDTGWKQRLTSLPMVCLHPREGAWQLRWLDPIARHDQGLAGPAGGNSSIAAKPERNFTMIDKLVVQDGGFRHLPGSTRPFSTGVAALDGHVLTRVRLRVAPALAEGLAFAASFLAARGRPMAALAACELRAPAALWGLGAWRRWPV